MGIRLNHPLQFLVLLPSLITPLSIGAEQHGAQAQEFEVPDGFKVIDSIAELREAMEENGQKIRMKPGTYRVEDTWPDDPKSVFICSGSNNTFDLRGVTVEVPSTIYRDMRGSVHSLAGYRIRGDNNTFKGATFRNTGTHAPYQALPEFAVTGGQNQFLDCRFIVRGSSPYGYGDLYGKGGGSAVPTKKHSGMVVRSKETLIEGCRFEIRSFGHGIFMQRGSDDTVIRNTVVQGDLRPSEELYEEATGPAAEHDYKIMFPPWKKGKPIPKDEMIHLPEDGIRAYTGAGRITVDHCRVVRMRGGITLTAAAKPAKVTDCTVIDCRHAYSLPSNSVVRNSQGNAVMGPLLAIPYSDKHDADIELELLAPDEAKGDHVLAGITGKGHRIRITAPSDYKPKKPRPIVIGRAKGVFTGRWTLENSSPETVRGQHQARDVTLINRTPHPVRLTQYTRHCTVKSQGPVTDEGSNNQAKRYD